MLICGASDFAHSSWRGFGFWLDTLLEIPIFVCCRGSDRDECDELTYGRVQVRMLDTASQLVSDGHKNNFPLCVTSTRGL